MHREKTYALTRLIFYIMTGRTNNDNIKDEKLKCFVEKGFFADKCKRFHSETYNIKKPTEFSEGLAYLVHKGYSSIDKKTGHPP